MTQRERAVRLVSGGDVRFTRPLASLPVANAHAARAAYAYLRRSDICFMNCEMPLTRRGHRVEKTVNLRSDPIVAKDLAELGIDVVTLANNHMLDYGYQGLADTLTAIEGVGIAHVGAGSNLDAALRPHFRKVGGLRFAFIGLAATLPPGFAAGEDRPGTAPIRVSYSFEIDANLMSEQPGTAPIVHTVADARDIERVTTLITEAKREADYVVVAIHWGLTSRRVTAYQGMIAEYQPPLGRSMIDAGADLILGNHSHNLHGIEVYRGRPIFYSLGNFIFEFDRPRPYMEPESLIVLADFDRKGLRVQLVPVLVNSGGFAEMVDDRDQDRIIALLNERSVAFGTRFTAGPEGIELDLGSSAGRNVTPEEANTSKIEEERTDA